MTRSPVSGPVLALAVFGMVCSASLAVFGQAKQKIDYETFCKLPDVQSRRSAFVAATPEEKAELMRTRVERWREANKARLNPKQVELLDDMRSFATPTNYATGAGAEDARIKFGALEARLLGLFTVADIQELQFGGPCLPKGK